VQQVSHDGAGEVVGERFVALIDTTTAAPRRKRGIVDA